MKVWPLVLRARAGQDVSEAIDFYLAEAGEKVTLGFINALEQGLELISKHPGVGANRYAHELDLPGLRGWPLKGYPYLVFYIQRADHIDVWRVLHAARDIPAWMTVDAI